jgi:hypothetical protein
VIAKAPAGTDVGAMLASTGAGFCKVTALVPEAFASAALTARTVTVLALGTVCGAVYIPDVLIVPVEAVPPVTPFTCQVTEVFDDPVTVALNDFVATALTFALVGETVTVTLCPLGGVLELEGDELLVAPVHPASAIAASRDAQSTECLLVKVLNFSIGRDTEGTALPRRNVRSELCLVASGGTTVRKDKIRRGTVEQDGKTEGRLASLSGERTGDALAMLALRFYL